MNHPTAQPTTRGDFYRLMSTIANHRPELYSLASEAERRYVAYPALLAALKDLLGISVDIVAGEERDTCRHCGRDYTEDNMEEAEKGNDPLYLCPSDDCPGYIARHAIALAEGTQP